MSSKSLHRVLCSLTIPLGLLVGCTAEESPSAGSEFTTERASLTDLRIVGDDSPTLLHPVRVAVAADVSGDPYSTTLLIGMRTADGEHRCSLGPVVISHDAADEGHFELETELGIDIACAELVGHEDVELFAAFDPWDQLGDKQLDEAALAEALEQGETDMTTIAEASALATHACESCERFTLQPSPGMDAQLRSLGLSSSVAVVRASTDKRDDAWPDITVSSEVRVTGVRKAAKLEPGSVSMRYGLRPVGSSDDWMPLVERSGEGKHVVSEVDTVEFHDHSHEVSRLTGLHIEGPTHERLQSGAWADASEFELQACVDTEFEQPVDANDCATLPLVIVREQAPVDTNELEISTGQTATPRSYNQLREPDVWQENWVFDSSFGQASLEVAAWLDLNASTVEGAYTYGGVLVEEPGVWFEAGTYAQTGDVFGLPWASKLTVADVEAALVAYDSGSGKLAMKATAVGYDFIPAFTLELDNGEPLTLQEIFDAANLDIDPSYAVSYGLGAKDFGDGCGGVSLALDLVGVVGIDTDLSTVTTSAGPDGPIIEAVVNPYAAVQVVGEASAGYIGALSASITATLNLLYANFPYTAVIEAVKSDAPDFLQLRIDENLSANLTTLSGDISYSVSYWCVATCYHQGTLVDWDGFALGEWSLFNKFTALNYGSGLAPGWCTGQAGTLHQGDFDGDGLDDQLCHNHESGDRATDKAVNGFVGTDWWAPGWCIGGEIHVGDFNGDGRDDQLCVADDEWHIDHADAQGNFGSSDWATGTQWCSAATQDMYVGDFNGDGLDDLLCHDHESGYRWIDYADNGFAFSDWASYGNWCGGASQGDSFSVGDYDGDERDDLRCDNNGYHWIDYAANYFGATDYEGTELPDNQQCGSVGGWYQSPAPTPVFDGSACKVMAWPVPLYPGENTFIYANRWYVTPGEGNDCSMGNFDGANCEIGLAPAGTTAYFVDDVPYYTYNPCGSVGSWYQNPAPVPTWDGSSCSVANVPVPPGENTFIYANHWYITPGEGNSCSMGNFDGANCDIGTPPLGATASFVDGYAVYTLP